MKTRFLLIICLIAGLLTNAFADSWNLDTTLAVNISNDQAQIEIGGPWIGAEMHHGSPLINRVSFYFPVANSLDRSEDYWIREQWRVMFLGIKIGDGPKTWISPGGFTSRYTPYAVDFYRKDSGFNIDISYRFLKKRPAMAMAIEIKNTQPDTVPIELYTHLETSVKTCHTYKFCDRATTSYNKSMGLLSATFRDPDTGPATVFIVNAATKPVSFGADADLLGLPESGRNWWMHQTSNLPAGIVVADDVVKPAAAFVYRRELKPDESFQVLQFIGSCRPDEIEYIAPRLIAGEHHSSAKYQDYLGASTIGTPVLMTHHRVVDHSVKWARSILGTNAHWFDGKIVPMPCPAQYNFYFTHDVLLTDLAAVQFDFVRVKRDLQFIVNHANKKHVIPHAYYWKDGRYVTEFADADNWNHFWFIQVVASYLRHTGDSLFVKTLMPCVTSSLQSALTHCYEDGLVSARRPDWWDIGQNVGPRAYMSILLTRTIREYLYLAATLDVDTDLCVDYEQRAQKVQTTLASQLWDFELEYLVNYLENGAKDRHYYTGSLLAAHFNLLNDQQQHALVRTATENLLDPHIGIYNAAPMDFHRYTKLYKFLPNEAGKPGYYMNGGIWPQGNAWYALALIADGQKQQAWEFINRIMTLDGISKSPNGYPAMYEYRVSDTSPAAYGKIDKPNFLWAGAWYLYTLRRLFGICENEWNVSFEPFLPDELNVVTIPLILNSDGKYVSIQGKGAFVERVLVDGKEFPSAVIPESGWDSKNIDVRLGRPSRPILLKLRSSLKAIDYSASQKILRIQARAFKGHRSSMKISATIPNMSITQNGHIWQGNMEITQKDGFIESTIPFVHEAAIDTFEVKWRQ